MQHVHSPPTDEAEALGVHVQAAAGRRLWIWPTGQFGLTDLGDDGTCAACVDRHWSSSYYFGQDAPPSPW